MVLPKLKPAVLDAEPTTDEVVLTWTQEGHNATYYEIIRGPNKIAQKPGTDRTYTDETVTEGGSYTYQLRGVMKTGTVIYSVILSNKKSVTVLTVPKPTSAPTLIATAGNAQVSLSWTAVPNATSYEWQRATGAGAFGSDNAAAGLSATDSTVVNATAYRFRVRGKTATYDGPWSNIPTVTPMAAVPVAPVLTGTPGDNQNSLDWDAVADADTFRLRYSEPPATTLTVFPDTAATSYEDDTAVNDKERIYTVRGVSSTGVLGGVSNAVTLTAVAAALPEVTTYVGFGGNATGGTGGTSYVCSTGAQFKAACETSGPRTITFTGTANIDGGGEIVTVENPNLTIDGTGFSKSIKRLGLRIRASNVLITQVRIRPGDNLSSPDDVDGLTINPAGASENVQNVVIDRCSILWGPDVTLGILNNCWGITVQNCILGAGLRRSAHSEASTADPGHSYGPNVTTIASMNDSTVYGQRITFYRNLIIHNYTGRNIRGMYTDNIEYINNVVYNWGNKLAHVNPRGGNYVGNMFKKGPGTRASTIVAESNPKNGESAIQNSVYWPTSGPDANIGIGFTPTVNWDNGVLRTDRYRPNAEGSALPLLQAATSALATAVVAGAGPTTVDTIDQLLKDNYAAGAGGAGTTGGQFWNGAGFPAPNPSW